jgi:Ras association domain-containing protein 7/8
MEELAMEQHNINREADEHQMMERKIIGEVEHLQNEVEQAKRAAEMATQCAESLKQEVVNLEAAIVEKKLQVERLVADMKEANLQSLTVACQDEQIKHLLEGKQ